MKLDHFAWISPSLDDAVAIVEELSGVRADYGGIHEGMGTRNALLSVGEGVYLAIDGPDPLQPPVGNKPRLAALETQALALFAVATDDLDAAHAALASKGLEATVGRGSRKTPRGQLLEWEYLDVKSHVLGSALPQVYRWIRGVHPSREAPEGCRLVDFRVEHPKTELVRSLYAVLGLDISVVDSETPRLIATFEGRKGRFQLPTP